MAPTRQYTNHPDPMDLWLETQGYYRKATARDGSCLFRAVAEQLFDTQKYHLDVRNQCVGYMLHHLDVFQAQEVEGSIEKYVEHMRNPSQWGGLVEILAMSQLYRVDFLIFKEVGVQAEKVTNYGFEKVIMLCFSHDRHYDSVYLKEYTKVAGFCQSLVYEVLYKNVFGMKDVDYAVDKMLHYKPLRHRNEIGACGQRKFYNYSCSSMQLQRKGISIDSLLDDAEVNVRDLLSKGITPFPYKVAKSLDPNIFRNVEFDVWIDYRRGLRHGYFGSCNELRVGVKCLVKIDDSTCVAHIQEMAPEKGPVVLFVEELGEKRTVPYESLELLPQDHTVKPQLTLAFRNQRYISSPLHLKQSLAAIQDCNGYPTGMKSRKGKTDDKGKENRSTPVTIPGIQHGSGGRRTRTKSLQSSVTDHDAEINSVCGQDDSGMVSYSSYSMENCSPHPSYQTFQAAVDIGTLAVPVQAHLVVPPQQRSTPLLVPLSPRIEDGQPYWLASHDSHGSSENNSPPSEPGLNSSGSQPLSPTDFFRFVPYTPPDPSPTIPEVPEGESEDSQSVKDQGGEAEVDINCNYLPSISSPTQINFKAPKSVLDNGADLPISDIQTLRFFYNLGNDVYRAQCGGVYGWGAYSQPCAPSCNPTCHGSPGLCVGECACGPVCITAVPTIHHLLEPSTPPRSTRRRRQANQGGLSPSSESELGEHTNLRSTGHSSHAPHPLAPRFKKDCKGKGKRHLKVFEGQPLVHSPTPQTPVTPTTPNFPSSIEMTSEAAQSDPAQIDNNDHSSSTVAISYPQSYGYVYYPSSPVVPYSPVENDPYFTPFRLQYSDFSPDGPQSPQCYSVGSSGEMGVYGTSPQFPVYAASPTPHYLVPTSPGIYVGSPPAWGPIAASSPQ